MNNYQTVEETNLNKLSYKVLTPTGSSPSDVLLKNELLAKTPYTFFFYFKFCDFKVDTPHCPANLDLLNPHVFNKAQRFHLFCKIMETHFGPTHGYIDGHQQLACVTLYVPPSRCDENAGGYVIIFFSSDQFFAPSFMMEQYINQRKKNRETTVHAKKKQRFSNRKPKKDSGAILNPSETALNLEMTIPDTVSVLQQHSLVTGIYYLKQANFRVYHQQWFKVHFKFQDLQNNEPAGDVDDLEALEEVDEGQSELHVPRELDSEEDEPEDGDHEDNGDQEGNEHQDDVCSRNNNNITHHMCDEESSDEAHTITKEDVAFLKRAIRSMTDHARRIDSARPRRRRWAYGDGVFGVEWILPGIIGDGLVSRVQDFWSPPNAQRPFWTNAVPCGKGIVTYDVPNHVLFNRTQFFTTEFFSPSVQLRLKREKDAQWALRDSYSNQVSPFLPKRLSSNNTPRNAFECSNGVAPPLHHIQTPEELCAINRAAEIEVRSQEANKVFEGTPEERGRQKQLSLSLALSRCRHRALARALPWFSRRGVADAQHPNLPSSAFQSTRKWGREYLAKNKNTFYRKFSKTTSNLSLFNDYMAKLLVDLEYIYKCNTVHSKTILALLSHLNSTDPARELKAHLFMLGPAGSSKSFCLMLVKKLSIPGTVSVRTYMTAKSDTASGNQDGLTVIIEEMQGDLASKEGANTTQQAILKARLCSGYTTVEEPYYDQKGQRSQRTLYCRSNCTFVVASNMKRRDMSSPIVDRFIMQPSMEDFRTDRELTQLICSVDSPELVALREVVNINFRWLQYHISMINMLIQCGVIPSVSLSFTMMVLPEIHRYSKKLGVTNTHRPRPTARLMAVMRTLVLIRAVLYVFGSPWSPLAPDSKSKSCLSDDPPETTKQWESMWNSSEENEQIEMHKTEHYLEVVPYLNDADPSLLTFAVGLLRHQWEPPLLADIIRVMSGNTNISGGKKKTFVDLDVRGLQLDTNLSDQFAQSPRNMLSNCSPYTHVGDLVSSVRGGNTGENQRMQTSDEEIDGEESVDEGDNIQHVVEELEELTLSGQTFQDSQTEETWYSRLKLVNQEYCNIYGARSRTHTMGFSRLISKPIREVFSENIGAGGLITGLTFNFNANDTFYKKLNKVARKIQARLAPKRPEVDQIVAILLQLAETVYTSIDSSDNPIQVRGMQFDDKTIQLAPQLIQSNTDGRMRSAVLLALSYHHTIPGQYMFGPDSTTKDKPYQYELVTTFKMDSNTFQVPNLNHLSKNMYRLMNTTRNTEIQMLMGRLQTENRTIRIKTPVEDLVLGRYLALHGLVPFTKQQKWLPERRLIAEHVCLHAKKKESNPVPLVIYPRCYQHDNNNVEGLINEAFGQQDNINGLTVDHKKRNEEELALMGSLNFGLL
jgi:hypothetical protein